MADLEIQNAFLEGINEVFSIMFTDKCKLYFLDTESTETNVYNETPEKRYKEPIEIVAKVVPSVSSENDDAFFKDSNACTVIIPSKQLIDNGIPFSTSGDFEEFSRCKVEYGGYSYRVTSAYPKTLVADMYQIVELSCIELRKDSLGRERST